MTGTIEFVGRKHGVAYVRSILGTIAVLAVWSAGAWIAALADWTPGILIGLGLCVLTAASGVYNLFLLRSVRWILTDEELRIEEGVLPWRRSSFGHPYETIFEAFYQFGFFAKLLGYGTCVIRRTDGVTTGDGNTHMADPERIVKTINARVRDLRKAGRAPAAPAGAARSDVEELAELARLRASGDLSEDEYAAMKARILGGPSSGTALAGGASAVEGTHDVH